VEQVFLDPTFLHKNDSQSFGSTRESVFKKYLFGTAPPDPRLESGAGAVPNGPLVSQFDNLKTKIKSFSSSDD
jgi:hypothetical protein